MRAIVTCDVCGHRQAVERPIREPESFRILCHSCETVLKVEVTGTDILRTNNAMIDRKLRRTYG